MSLGTPENSATQKLSIIIVINTIIILRIMAAPKIHNVNTRRLVS